MILYFSFYLHLASNLVILNIFICVFGHLYVIYKEMSISSVLFWIVFFFFLNIALYELFIVEINILSLASFAIIFSHSVGCLFTLFMAYFAV